KRTRARRGRRGQATIASTRPTRAPIGTPVRVVPSSSSPFAHIQVIAPASRGDSESEDHQPTFTSPSYQIVADSALLGDDQDKQASPAPAPMRPTFAAKARAAELNAARARKTNRESSKGNSPTVPTSTPVSLGAFTKFKPASRNRGNKVWKPLNLSDVYDDNAVGAEDEHHNHITNEEISTNDGFLAPVASSRDLPDETLHSETFFAGLSAEISPEVAYAVPELDDQEWDPDLPSVHDHEEMLPPAAACRPSVADRVAAEQAPSPAILKSIASQNALSMPKQAQQIQQIHDRTPLPYLDVQVPKPATPRDESNRSPRVNLPVQAEQEAKLASLGVGPAAPIHDHGKHIYPSHYPSAFFAHTEDPFVDVGGYNMLNFSSVRTTPFDYNAEYSRRKGTMDREFRFPGPALYQPGTAAQNQMYSVPFATNEPMPQLHPYPMAYDGRGQTFLGQGPSQPAPPSTTGNNQNHGIRSAKREQLLISLNNIAEASKARGQSRTVLYDPVSAQGHQPTDSTQTEPFPLITVEKQPPIIEGSKSNGLFEFSEELPWKDRPVEIHTEIMPSLSNAELAAHGHALEMGTTPNKQAMPGWKHPASKYSAYSAERIKAAEKWFHTDNRGGTELLAHLNQVSDNELAKAQSAEHGDSSHRQETPGVSASAAGSGRVAHPAAGDIANRLLAPLLVTLQSYLSAPPESQPRQFGRFGVVPEWCIDRSPEGSKSFFGEDWGAPPLRVGRDPRYRPMMHETRYTVYEEGPGAIGEGFIRRRW
ncbi:MAG: hypothetical protein M1835_000921, partial [Candelina submexicana]